MSSQDPLHSPPPPASTEWPHSNKRGIALLFFFLYTDKRALTLPFWSVYLCTGQNSAGSLVEVQSGAESSELCCQLWVGETRKSWPTHEPSTYLSPPATTCTLVWVGGCLVHILHPSHIKITAHSVSSHRFRPSAHCVNTTVIMTWYFLLQQDQSSTHRLLQTWYLWIN